MSRSEAPAGSETRDAPVSARPRPGARGWSGTRLVAGSQRSDPSDAAGNLDAPERASQAGPPRRRPRWRIALITALCLCLVAAVGWVVMVSSVLGVRSVQVSGTALLDPGQVRTAAGVRDGAPLARLDTGAVARRVEKLPEVLRAKVDVSYPSTVRIQVTERVAVAFVRGDDGRPVLVDDSGAAFRAVAQPPGGAPELVASGQSTRQAAAQVSGALPPALRSQVASIRADSVNALTLKLGDGRTVLWGASKDNAAKVRLLTALLGQPGDTFDISAEGIVVVR